MITRSFFTLATYSLWNCSEQKRIVRNSLTESLCTHIHLMHMIWHFNGTWCVHRIRQGYTRHLSIFLLLDRKILISTISQNVNNSREIKTCSVDVAIAKVEVCTMIVICILNLLVFYLKDLFRGMKTFAKIDWNVDTNNYTNV